MHMQLLIQPRAVVLIKQVAATDPALGRQAGCLLSSAWGSLAAADALVLVLLVLLLLLPAVPGWADGGGLPSHEVGREAAGRLGPAGGAPMYHQCTAC
jgi:hypothetical protein